MWIVVKTNMTTQDLSQLPRPAPSRRAPATLLEFARSTIPTPKLITPRKGLVEFGIETRLLKRVLAPIEGIEVYPRVVIGPDGLRATALGNLPTLSCTVILSRAEFRGMRCDGHAIEARLDSAEVLRILKTPAFPDALIVQASIDTTTGPRPVLSLGFRNRERGTRTAFRIKCPSDNDRPATNAPDDCPVVTFDTTSRVLKAISSFAGCQGVLSLRAGQAADGSQFAASFADDDTSGEMSLEGKATIQRFEVPGSTARLRASLFRKAVKHVTGLPGKLNAPVQVDVLASGGARLTAAFHKGSSIAMTLPAVPDGEDVHDEPVEEEEDE
jgi:hypothetical protein